MLCIRTLHQMVSAEDMRGFFRLLSPTLALAERMEAFKIKHNWDKYTWIGVHMRMTDFVKYGLSAGIDDFVCAMKRAEALNADTWFMENANNIRFYVATDDVDALPKVSSHFPPGRLKFPCFLASM